MDIIYTDTMTGEEYNELRLSVDWKPLTSGQAERGLAHTAFVVAARVGERIVGMGRMLFDFGYTAYLGDVIVRPEYQGMGIGTEIVTRLKDKVMETAEPGEEYRVDEKRMISEKFSVGDRVAEEKAGYLVTLESK